MNALQIYGPKADGVSLYKYLTLIITQSYNYN